MPETPTPGAPGAKEFVIARPLDAPRERVWEAFTDPARMKQWWGPKGFSVIVSKMELRPGGTYHYGLRAPNGTSMWGKFVYREIVRPERLVLVSSFSDEAGGIARHPMSATWPREMLSTFLFADEGGKTGLTIKWSPISPTPDEQATFTSSFPNMQQGWSGTLDQLVAYLAKPPKQ